MSDPKRLVLMIGPALSAPGGMSAVAQTYADAGWFDREDVRYLSSYEGPGLFRQLRVFGKSLLCVLSLLIRGRIRLLHVHSASRGSFWRKSMLCCLARLFGVPYVFHLHSGEFPNWWAARGRLGRAWANWILRGAARVLALTPAWAARISELAPGARVAVAWNPLPAGMSDYRPARRRERPRRVLFLGRVRALKGAFDLLAAWPEVIAGCPDAKLVLAGDGELDKAAALARELGISASVELPGWLNGANKLAALEAADVFVLPSYAEGLPVGVLEAMAVGVPVVATPVGGVPDLLVDGVSGLLVAPGDAKALAQALKKLLADAALGERLASTARTNLPRHEVGQVTEALSALYAELA